MSSREFWQGETWAIVKAMKTSGNHPGVIADWKEKVVQWAQANSTDPNAVAVNAWLPAWQPRPFYTAGELAPMWPALAIAVGHTTQWPNVLKSPARLANELNFAGLPRLLNAWQGYIFKNPLTGEDSVYYIVEHIHLWQTRTLSQEEFENVFNG